MKIGEIATLTGLPVETIRYYEKIGLLLPPTRNGNGYRHYRQLHIERLLFIKRCRILEMTLDEIRQLIDLAQQSDTDCNDVNVLLARHLEHVRERLHELACLEQTLVKLQNTCGQGHTMSECGILGNLRTRLDTQWPSKTANPAKGPHGSDCA